MIDPTKDPRCAGLVDRYHTWPTIKEQTVSDHSWNVARIVLALYPEADAELLQAALFHDIGEIKVGDLPFPLKSQNPELKRIHNKLEEDAHYQMCLPWLLPPPVTLDDWRKRVLKLSDMIEMWEFGLQEIMFGSQFAIKVRCKTEEWISEELGLLREEPNKPGWMTKVPDRVETYMSRRIKEWS